MAHFTLRNILLTVPTAIYAQQYELIQTYTPRNFFEAFNFFSGQDPTGGFVQYVPFETAAATGLVVNSSDAVYLGVDTTNVYPPSGPGRPSVRLESKLTFTEGLFVLDLTHIPTGCGVWPAFWTVGLGDWPLDGEIDIIENVNDEVQNHAALHASGECEVSAAVSQTGTWKSTNCSIGHDGNEGCGSKLTEPDTFGKGFNSNGGGVYAMEWTSSAVYIWFFPPNNIPESLTSTNSHPDSSGFGKPSAAFAGPCSNSFSEKFFNHTIIFNTDLCGGWAGTTFGLGDTTQCLLLQGSTSEDSCVSFVGNNPQAFKEAYWGIKSLRVWQKSTPLETPYSIDSTVPAASVISAIKEPVALVSLEDTVNTVPYDVVPLTGGILTAVNNIQGTSPTPIDPRIGEGSFPATIVTVPQTSPGAWNTETLDVPAPLPSVPIPGIPGVGAAGPTEGGPRFLNRTADTIIPTMTESIVELPYTLVAGSLKNTAQSQPPALANALSNALAPAIMSYIPTVAQASHVVPQVMPEIVSEAPALDSNDTSQAHPQFNEHLST